MFIRQQGRLNPQNLISSATASALSKIKMQDLSSNQLFNEYFDAHRLCSKQKIKYGSFRV